MVSSLNDAFFVSCPHGPNSPPPEKKKTKGEKSAAGRIRTCDERYGMAHSRAGTVNKRKKGERDKETDRSEQEIRARRKAQMRCCEHYGREEEEEEEEEGGSITPIMLACASTAS
jgi:hypothetical protein